MDARGRAFASDFDGTLCESNWETGEEHIDQRDIDAIRRYQQAGGLFGICTGRPLFAVTESIKGLVEPDFYIVTTGAQVLGREGVVLFEQTMGHDLAQEFYERYGQDDSVVMLVVTDTVFVSVGRMMRETIPMVERISDVDGQILGVSLEYSGDEEAAAAAAADINDRYAGILEGFQNLGSVDIVRAGCSKGAGVRQAKEGLGVHTIAGIGDSYNDLSLLEAADVAYTFGHVPEVVKDAADAIVGSVAEALEHFCA